ncbi:unnamed protein product, partial [Didymodactylos carnosus]
MNIIPFLSRRRRKRRYSKTVDSLFLTTPDLHKKHAHDKNKYLEFGLSQMQGWRSSMEDTHCFLMKFDPHAWSEWSYFSIFDGHNGTETAKKCAENFHGYMLQALNDMLKHDHVEGPVTSSKLDIETFRKVIKQTYFYMDDKLKKTKSQQDESGAVAITCLI